MRSRKLAGVTSTSSSGPIYSSANSSVTCLGGVRVSASSDPEGQPLTYAWSDNGTKLASTSAVWAYQTTSGHHSIRLDVFDPAGLSGNQTQDVVVP